MTDQPKFRAIVSADLFRRAMSCVSTEETRYYLNGVHIEPHPEKGAVLVSTDGHRLICLHDPKAIIENRAIVRPNAAILAALKSSARAKNLLDGRGALLVVDGQRMAIVAHDPGDDYATGAFDKLGARLDETVIALQWHSSLIDGTFPNWRRVVPRPEDLKADGPIGEFNPSLLDGVARALSSDKGPGVRVTAPGPADPHLVRVSNPEIDGFAILMPMRAGLPQTYPTFVEALFPKPVEPPKSEPEKADEKVATMTAARAKTRKTSARKPPAKAKAPSRSDGRGAPKAPAKKKARAR